MLKQLIQPLWFVHLALQCSYEPPSLLRIRRTVSKHSFLCPPPSRAAIQVSKIFSVKVLIEALTHTVRDLPSGATTGRHGDNPPSGRTSPREASSSYSERYQASCCDLQSIPRRPHACSTNTSDTASCRTSSYHEGSGHLISIGYASCPCHNRAITTDLSSAIDLRLLLPRFLTPDLHHSPDLARSATAPPTTSASTSKAH